MPLSASRALTVRATFERLILAIRADDRESRACEVVERITALGCTVVVTEHYVRVYFPECELSAEYPRHHTQWLLTLQACLSSIIEQTRTLESPE